MLGTEWNESLCSKVISPDTFLAVNVAFCNCFHWIWGVLYAAYAPGAPHFYPPSTPCMFFRNALSTPKLKSIQLCAEKNPYVTTAFFLCCLIKWQQRSGFLLLFLFCKRDTIINRESEKKDGFGGFCPLFQHEGINGIRLAASWLKCYVFSLQLQWQ